MNLKWFSIITSIISISAPLLMIRVYLGYFDNASLLSEDIASTNILNGVSVFISLSVLMFILLIFLPSIFFGLVVPKKSSLMWNYDKIKVATGKSLVLNAAYSSAMFFTILFLSDKFKMTDKWTSSLLLSLFITGVVTINFIVFRKPVNMVADYKDEKIKNKIKMIYFLVYPLGGTFMFLLNCFGLSVMLESVNHEKITNSFTDFVKLSSLMVFLCITNIFPGVIFMHLHDQTSPLRAGLSALISALCGLLLMAFVMTSILPLLINTTMVFTGIADWQVRTYLIDGTDYPKEKFEQELWLTKDSDSGKNFTVSGIMVYSLNKTKLLCPAKIKSAYTDRLHFVPWNNKYDKDVAAVLTKVSSLCQPFTDGGVRRLSESR